MVPMNEAPIRTGMATGMADLESRCCSPRRFHCPGFLCRQGVSSQASDRNPAAKDARIHQANPSLGPRLAPLDASLPTSVDVAAKKPEDARTERVPHR
jgi:hypothetical protein